MGMELTNYPVGLAALVRLLATIKMLQAEGIRTEAASKN